MVQETITKENKNLVLDNASISFISYLNSEINNLNITIKKQEKKIEMLNHFFNNLSVIKKECNDEEKNAEYSRIEERAKNMINTLKESVLSVQNIKNNLSNTNKEIENLLQNVENSGNTSKFTAIADGIKNKIEIYYQELTNIKSTLYKLDLRTNNFFNNTIANVYKSGVDTSNKEQDDNTTKNEDINTQTENIQNEINNEIKDHASTLKDNNVLIISEKLQKVFLPYKVEELKSHFEKEPSNYTSLEDVIEKKYIVPLSYYTKHPITSRFKETYILMTEREKSNIVDTIKTSIDMMFKLELNPAIITACKSKNILLNYLTALKENKLEDFKDFEVKFEIAPL